MDKPKLIIGTPHLVIPWQMKKYVKKFRAGKLLCDHCGHKLTKASAKTQEDGTMMLQGFNCDKCGALCKSIIVTEGE